MIFEVPEKSGRDPSCLPASWQEACLRSGTRWTGMPTIIFAIALMDWACGVAAGSNKARAPAIQSNA
jgi:hypothetical protein